MKIMVTLQPYSEILLEVTFLVTGVGDKSKHVQNVCVPECRQAECQRVKTASIGRMPNMARWNANRAKCRPGAMPTGLIIRIISDH